MAWIRTDTVKGHQYQSLRHSFREGNKVRSEVIAWLGAVSPISSPRKQNLCNESPEKVALSTLRKANDAIASALPPPSPDTTRSRCSACKGIGKKQVKNHFEACSSCFGFGYLDKLPRQTRYIPDGTVITCIKCSGRGKLNHKPQCPCCQGKGEVTRLVDKLDETDHKVRNQVQNVIRPDSERSRLHINRAVSHACPKDTGSSLVGTTAKAKPNLDMEPQRENTKTTVNDSTITHTAKSIIHPKSNFKHLRIDVERLHKESESRIHMLISKGSKPTGQVLIKHGSKLEIKRKGRNVIVLTPNKVSASSLRRSIAKAHGMIALDSLQESHPKTFKRIGTTEKDSFHTSLITYSVAMKSGKDFKRYYKALGIRYFGNLNHQRNFRSPNKWCIYEYSERLKSWQDQIVIMYGQAECSKGGFHGFAKELKAEVAKSANILKKLEREKETAKGRWKRKDIERDIGRAQLRHAILCINERRLSSLSALFYSASNSPFSAQNPI